MPLTIPTVRPLTVANFLTAVLKPFVDSVEATANAAQASATSANTLASQKYTVPTGGIPESAMDAPAQMLIGAVQVRRYASGAWQVRGTTSLDVTVLWLKFTAADPNPPSGGTGVVVGHDVVLLATA